MRSLINAVGHVLLTEIQEEKMRKELSTAEWLTEQQSRIGVPDQVLADALGYESARVIEMFKTGQMRVPFTKAPALADALGVKPGDLMRRLLADADQELLQAIERCLGPLCLSDGEQRLIQAIRRVNPVREPVPLIFDRDAIITLIVA